MRISVALCTFNGQAYLPRQLRSLADQERLPDELIVSDDGSTDQTVSIIRRFAESAPFRVALQCNPVGLGVTRNFASAIAAATGEVIACCDQDDVWYPEKMAAIEGRFQTAAVDLVFSDGDVVDDDLRPLGYTLFQSCGFTPRLQSGARLSGLAALLTRFNVVTGAAMAFSARWRDVLLPIPDGWVHDGWIGLVLASLGRCEWLDRPLLAYRRHSLQQIGAPPRTLLRQVDTARRMDAAYFAGQAENFEDCLARITASGKSCNGDIADLLRQKVEHCRARVRMRTDPASKIRLIARELWTGRYRSAAMGWKSLAQDICLARRTEEGWNEMQRYATLRRNS